MPTPPSTPMPTPVPMPAPTPTPTVPPTSSTTRSRQTPTPAPTPKGGQSNQKWDEMLTCLENFILEQTTRERNRRGPSAGLPPNWKWDGNVPTNYRTPDGRALGRWINNQRSAKNKNVLKPEREERLVRTGLKWCVLATNTWEDMMGELRLYVQERTKDGKDWDGNVPTNYKIRSNVGPDGTEMDEEKNLGRWINRQRSLFQAGKMKKERQLELEALGLKWSVLSTSTWESMFDALVEYARKRRLESPNNEWDGSVPANHKTEDGKSLGRWVNRQRASHARKKLKREFVEKLNSIGFRLYCPEKKNSGILVSTNSVGIGVGISMGNGVGAGLGIGGHLKGSGGSGSNDRVVVAAPLCAEEVSVYDHYVDVKNGIKCTAVGGGNAVNDRKVSIPTSTSKMKINTAISTTKATTVIRNTTTTTSTPTVVMTRPQLAAAVSMKKSLLVRAPTQAIPVTVPSTAFISAPKLVSTSKLAPVSKPTLTPIPKPIPMTKLTTKSMLTPKTATKPTLTFKPTLSSTNPSTTKSTTISATTLATTSTSTSTSAPTCKTTSATMPTIISTTKSTSISSLSPAITKSKNLATTGTMASSCLATTKLTSSSPSVAKVSPTSAPLNGVKLKKDIPVI
uniref:Helicase-associated domain-containing protein n=1 Tax=Corethron hystrix TaxID=216773 RepID=A0A6U5G2Q3_9STRA|mmetsp:Transcript_253/g.560  ORF Transcript_253/g.560 Transcript_253/m.560 type:complete len:624 (+) Transcript_253:410-2281(+)